MNKQSTNNLETAQTLTRYGNMLLDTCFKNADPNRLDNKLKKEQIDDSKNTFND